MKEDVGALVDMAYDALEGADDLMRYHKAHGTMSLLILTQYDSEVAANLGEYLKVEIVDKVVIEIGAGVGFLAIEMAKYARQVFAIEVDPAWSWVFTRSLYAHKPPNLTWIFGKAQTVLPWLHGDVCVIVTRSDIEALRKLGKQFAPKVIMPLQELELEETLITISEGGK